MAGVDECAASPRVQGAALDMYLGKRPLRQAPALHPMCIAASELASFCEKDVSCVHWLASCFAAFTAVLGFRILTD